MKWRYFSDICLQAKSLKLYHLQTIPSQKGPWVMRVYQTLVVVVLSADSAETRFFDGFVDALELDPRNNPIFEFDEAARGMSSFV